MNGKNWFNIDHPILESKSRHELMAVAPHPVPFAGPKVNDIMSCKHFYALFPSSLSCSHLQTLGLLSIFFSVFIHYPSPERSLKNVLHGRYANAFVWIITLYQTDEQLIFWLKSKKVSFAIDGVRAVSGVSCGSRRNPFHGAWVFAVQGIGSTSASLSWTVGSLYKTMQVIKKCLWKHE